MQTLYFFTIYPLELLYSLVYGFFADLSGSYGYALLLLSLASWFLFSPLKRLTASAQRNEAEIQEVMAPQLAKLKAESRGGERQRRINALYRRYAYHPLLGLRLSFGIFMQIPFLCAAYYMLLALPALHGQSFGILPDLGSPDGLLWGVNALPLLMTGVNFLALFMSSDLTAGQKRQGILVALLFLVLLYSSPSALLVYWTGNNVLSALETAFKHYGKRLLPHNTAKRKTWVPTLRPGEHPRNLYAFGCEPHLYFTATALLVFIVFVYSPHALLSSGFSPFEEPPASLVLGLVPYALLAGLLLVLVRLHLPAWLRPGFTLLCLFCSLVALVYSTINPVDFGSLDVVWLSRGQELASPAALATDALILLGILLAMLLLLYCKKERLILTFVQSSLVIMAGYTGFTLFTAPAPQQTAETATHYSFSKEQKNVAIFFLDMFTGGHIEDIFARDPALAERFAGFTWFPDTVAVSSMTSASAPSMYGGNRYTPQEMDKRPDMLLMDKFSEGMAAFAENFIQQGYTVNFEHNDYDVNREYFKDSIQQGSLRLVKIPQQKALDQYLALLEQRGETAPELSATNADFLLLLGAFKAAPYALKRILYDDARWQGVNAFAPQMKKTMYNAARLACLPKLSDTKAQTPTLNYFYNALPHFSWHLPANSLVPVPDPFPATEGQLTKVNGVLPEHVLTEVRTLHFLADFVDWLRAEAMLDNTLIILASDHCEADSRMLNTALGVTETGHTGWQENNAFRGRPHALLMMKDFASNGPFRIDPALMSSQDVPALACTAIGGCDTILPVDADPQRVRYHHYGFSSWQQLEIPGKKTYDAYRSCIIRGSMFERKNWTLPE